MPYDEDYIKGNHLVGAGLDALFGKHRPGRLKYEGVGSYIGATLGDIIRSKGFGLDTQDRSSLRQAIELEEAKQEMETNKLQQILNASNKAPKTGVDTIINPRLESYKVGGATVKFPKTEEEHQREIRRKVEEEEATQRIKGLAGESAGKFSMLDQAKTDIQEARKMIFDEKGNLKKQLIARANVPGGRAPVIGRIIPDVGWGGDARMLASKMNNALEAKLRIETGAAATQEEFNRLQQRFGITIFDTAESAKDKLNRLEEFMDKAIITIDPIGKFKYKTGDKRLDGELNKSSEDEKKQQETLDNIKDKFF